MGGQGIERRQVLRYIGLASVAGTFPGFNRWAFACQDHVMEAHVMEAPAAAAAATAPTVYTPLFFSPQQFELVEHLTEMIIPADDKPGAKQAGVAEFIDFMVANRVPVDSTYDIRSTNDAIRAGDEAQVRFQAGLDWLNAQSKLDFGREFMACGADEQNRLLEELAYKDKYKPATAQGRQFFQLIRDYTVVGFYTSKMGLESLDFPGLQTVYAHMPGCDHMDDPEHARLDEPKSIDFAVL
jgi:gluconate 2-dehydrogenase gamma chain